MARLIAPAAAVIQEVRPGESLEPFIDLAWTCNAHDPLWVPPLRLTLRSALDRNRHPFHRHARVAYFVARLAGRPVGRIAAIVNPIHNDFHGDRVGFFGLFECEDDPETARALFAAAATWLREQGMETMRGPMNFSTNDEISSPGILIDGFETPPMLMMSHNPRYYATLCEHAGMTKIKDLLAFGITREDIDPAGAHLIDRLMARSRITLRTLDLKRFQDEIEAIKEVYNSAWSKNWGFVPLSDAEFDHLAREFRPIVDPDFCFVAESEGRPVGFSLTLPNLNEALHHLPDGRLLPFGWARLLWHKRRIRSFRVLTLGLKPHLHRAGLGPAFYLNTSHATARKGFDLAEASWILEDNYEMVSALERMGGRVRKRYRIFERPI